MLLGGTILQLVVPAAFAAALWRQGDRHGATVPLWWLGQSCWNVSVIYAAAVIAGWLILIAEAARAERPVAPDVGGAR